MGGFTAFSRRPDKTDPPDHYVEKKPYKCPVCEGTGCDATGYKIAEHDKCNRCCNGCQGKGIVWG